VVAEPERAHAFFEALAERVDERLFGLRDPLRLVMVGILTGNHVLIDDVPGVGKTTLVRILATSLGLSFRRVQFTPDLMPSDVTGTSILDLKTNDFEFRSGPIFTQVLLADEINRATPKTQAALLEAMQERQVTVDGVTHGLPDLFFVLATHNPVELEGTFPLPEAQLDRFLLRVKLGYPSEREEERILLTHPSERVLPDSPVPDLPALAELREDAARIGLEHPVRRYIVELARATRDHPELAVGASPRAVEQMGDATRALALLEGRDYVLPDDVKASSSPCSDTGWCPPPTRGSATATPTRSFARCFARSPCRRSCRWTRRSAGRSRCSSRSCSGSSRSPGGNRSSCSSRRLSQAWRSGPRCGHGPYGRACASRWAWSPSAPSSVSRSGSACGS
jgi:MoxR-like ATPase